MITFKDEWQNWWNGLDRVNRGFRTMDNAEITAGSDIMGTSLRNLRKEYKTGLTDAAHKELDNIKNNIEKLKRENPGLTAIPGYSETEVGWTERLIKSIEL